MKSIQGKVGWQSPSNIALVKYWGKYGRQLPKNPSISFTLSEAHTKTYIDFEYDNNQQGLELDFLFEGAPQASFKEKLVKYCNSIIDELSLLKHLNLKVSSTNSFPHSSGIASSASGMSAFVLCLLEIEKIIKNHDQLDYQRASHLSRLASGSASRSVYGGLVVWGDSEYIIGSSNEFALPLKKEVHPDFKSFHDDILIISAEEKSVSSRAGHALMNDNPYASSRYAQANQHLKEIVIAMEKGDMDTFGSIVEKEALTLHALMMASQPPYMLIQPNTINAINAIWAFRKSTNVPVYFTLDAGPNIHLLYPSRFSENVKSLKEELISFCHNGKIIEDKTGLGPSPLS